MIFIQLHFFLILSSFWAMSQTFWVWGSTICRPRNQDFDLFNFYRQWPLHSIVATNRSCSLLLIGFTVCHILFVIDIDFLYCSSFSFLSTFNHGKLLLSSRFVYVRRSDFRVQNFSFLVTIRRILLPTGGCHMILT